MVCCCAMVLWWRGQGKQAGQAKAKPAVKHELVVCCCVCLLARVCKAGQVQANLSHYRVCQGPCGVLCCLGWACVGGGFHCSLGDLLWHFMGPFIGPSLGLHGAFIGPVQSSHRDLVGKFIGPSLGLHWAFPFLSYGFVWAWVSPWPSCGPPGAFPGPPWCLPGVLLWPCVGPPWAFAGPSLDPSCGLLGCIGPSLVHPCALLCLLWAQGVGPGGT